MIKFPVRKVLYEASQNFLGNIGLQSLLFSFNEKNENILFSQVWLEMGLEGFKPLQYLQETARPTWKLPIFLEDFLLCFGNFRNGATAVSKDRYSRCRGQ